MKRKIVYTLVSMLILLSVVGCNKEKENVVIEDSDIVTSEDVEEDINNENIEDNEKVDLQEDIKIEKTIVIDPGHSSVGNPQKEPISPNSSETKPKDVLGATGAYTGIPEYKTTVSIGALLKNELELRGYNVVMTKTEESQSISNIERADIGNNYNADLVIRIHADSSENHGVRGASLLIPEDNNLTSNIYQESKIYGEKIINSYANELNIDNRGIVPRNDMTGFNWSKVPVVILEMGFLSNKEEDYFISNTENHYKISKAIANGIDKCFD